MSFIKNDLAIKLDTAKKQRITIPFKNEYKFKRSDFCFEFWLRGCCGDDNHFLLSQGGFEDELIQDADGGFYAAYENGMFKLYLESDNHEKKHWLEANYLDSLDNLWHHIAFVRTGTKLSLFLDGQPVESREHRQGLEDDETVELQSEMELVIGSPDDLPEEMLHGEMELSQVRIWSCSRTLEDIAGLMNHELSKETAPRELIGLWNFEDETAKDESRLENNGTYVNNPGVVGTSIKFLSPGTPYLHTQSLFMQDYITINDLSHQEIIQWGSYPDQVTFFDQYVLWVPEETKQLKLGKIEKEELLEIKVISDNFNGELLTSNNDYIFWKEGKNLYRSELINESISNSVVVDDNCIATHIAALSDNRLCWEDDDLLWRLGEIKNDRLEKLANLRREWKVQAINGSGDTLYWIEDGTHFKKATVRGDELIDEKEIGVLENPSSLISNMGDKLYWFDDMTHLVHCRPGNREISGYRTVLTLLNEDNSPYHDAEKEYATVQLWADYTIQAWINNQPFSVPEVGQEPLEVQTTNSGKLVIITESEEKFETATLTAKTTFMETEEVVKIAPDRHLHYTMSGVTGAQLKGETDKHARVPDLTKNKGALLKGDNQQYANAVAKMINNMMAVSAEHNAMAGDPAESVLGANNPATGQDVSAGAAISPRGYIRHVDLIKTEPRPDKRPTIQVVNAEAMDAEHFEINFETGETRNLEDHEVETLRKNCRSIVAGDASTHDFHVRHGIHYHPTVNIGLEDYRKRRSLTGNDPYQGIYGGFFDWIQKAVKVVVHTVKHVIEEIGKEVKTVFMKVVDKLGKAADFIVETVQQAAEKVKDVLKKVEVSVKEAMSFFRTIFSWDDILTTQEAISHYFSTSLSKILTFTDEIKTTAHKSLQDIKKKIDENIDNISENLRQKSSQQYSTGKIGGVRQQWVTDVIQDHKESITFTGLKDSKVNIGDLGDKLKNKADEHTDLKNQLTDKLKSHKQPGKEMIANLLESMKPLLTGGVELVDKIISVVMDVIHDIIGDIKSMLELRIEIPILTYLFEEVITQGKSKLSVLNFISLITAVPASVVLNMAKLQLSDPTVIDQGLAKMKEIKQEDLIWISLNVPEATNNSGNNEVPDWFKYMSSIAGIVAASLKYIRGLIKSLIDAMAIPSSALEKIKKFLFVFTALDAVALFFVLVFSFPRDGRVWFRHKTDLLDVYLIEIAFFVLSVVTLLLVGSGAYFGLRIFKLGRKTMPVGGTSAQQYWKNLEEIKTYLISAIGFVAFFGRFFTNIYCASRIATVLKDTPAGPERDSLEFRFFNRTLKVIEQPVGAFIPLFQALKTYPGQNVESYVIRAIPSIADLISTITSPSIQMYRSIEALKKGEEIDE